MPDRRNLIKTISVLFMLAISAAAYAATDLVKFQKDLAARRLVIEGDRKALNRDCSKVSTNDRDKVKECSARHNDVRARMDSYKKDMLHYKRLLAEKAKQDALKKTPAQKTTKKKLKSVPPPLPDGEGTKKKSP